MAVSTMKPALKIDTNTNISVDPILKKKLFLARNGYIDSNELCKTLQGSIWLAKHQSTQQSVAIKIALRELVNKSSTRFHGTDVEIKEDIKSEASLLKYVSTNPECPSSITKYITFFKRYDLYARAPKITSIERIT